MGLCFPRRRTATKLASLPRTHPCASTMYHFLSTSVGFALYVFMIQSSQLPKTSEKVLFIIYRALCQEKNRMPKGLGRADLISALLFPCPQRLFCLTSPSISNTLQWLWSSDQLQETPMSAQHMNPESSNAYARSSRNRSKVSSARN